MRALYERYAHLERPLRCFVMLRGALAQPVERRLLLDRALFLRERAKPHKPQEPQKPQRSAHANAATAPAAAVSGGATAGDTAGDGGGGIAGDEGGGISRQLHVEMVPLFDPLLSPRNTAIVACIKSGEDGAPLM